MIRFEILNDQINSDRWAELADYIFSANDDWFIQRVKEKNPDLKRFWSKTTIGSRGIIFCGHNQSIRDCLANIPESGHYILITRDNDNSVTEEIYGMKPRSIVHWFAINCPIVKRDVTAIPVGMATTGGWNNTILIEAKEYQPQPVSTRIFSRLTLTPKTNDRRLALEINQQNPLVKIVHENIPGDEFCRHVMDHEFVLAPIGEGKDCLRMCESVSLGAIPILTECPELIAFDDMPVIYTRDYNFTNEWLDQQKELIIGKSIERLTMSYWKNKLQLKKDQYGIGY